MNPASLPTKSNAIDRSIKRAKTFEFLSRLWDKLQIDRSRDPHTCESHESLADPEENFKFGKVTKPKTIKWSANSIYFYNDLS